jgi:hypothetical protein
MLNKRYDNSVWNERNCNSGFVFCFGEAGCNPFSTPETISSMFQYVRYVHSGAKPKQFYLFVITQTIPHLFEYIVKYMRVTVDGAWIFSKIYRTLSERNYMWQSLWVTRSKDHCNHITHKVLPVFLSRCSFEASNSRRSSSSRFQLPASHSNSSQRLNLTHSLHWLIVWPSNCPAHNMSARTAQKTQFLIFLVHLSWERVCLRSLTQ